jgi:hypothetical protein
MNNWYFAPASADMSLLQGISHDAFELLPADLAQSIRTSADSLVNEGKSNVYENGLSLDYLTLVNLATRFANSATLRKQARNEQVQRNRYNHLYRS